MIGEFANNLKEIIVWDKGYAPPAMMTQVMDSGITTGKITGHSRLWNHGKGYLLSSIKPLIEQ